MTNQASEKQMKIKDYERSEMAILELKIGTQRKKELFNVDFFKICMCVFDTTLSMNQLDFH
jgi:hypothetical protein